ncbi:Hypothetical protein D9617_13g100340 [Elsinoe fawcettii]|nr:Hypothetical protein D9617_13g100340 [Elsinoe fawcettii]
MASSKPLGPKSQRELYEEMAPFLKPEQIPAKLRCATCSELVLNAFKLPCCDQTICENCSQKVPETCPVCTHSPLDKSLLNPHKSLRMTVTAYLRSEIKKRLPKPAVPKKEETKLPAESEETADRTQASENVPATEPDTVVGSGEIVDDVNKDARPAEPENSVSVPEENAEKTNQGPLASDEQGTGSDYDQTTGPEITGHLGEEQSREETTSDVMQNSQNTNSMPTGMSSNAFGGFNGIMGMPNMGMGMPGMFNGFGGMSMGNMNAMNMSMMNGFGWNGQQAFPGNFGYFPNDGYNQSYGNGMRQYHNQGNFNRFQGQGSFRGRGRGFRGRGRFNQNYQGYHNQQEWNNESMNGVYDGTIQSEQDYSQEEHAGDQGTSTDQNQFNEVGDAQNNAEGQDTSVELPSGDAQDNTTSEYVQSPALLHGNDGMTLGGYETARETSSAAKASEPPLNAPTGPRAMREPRQRRESRLSFVHESRRASIASLEQQTPASHDVHEERYSRETSRERQSKRERSRSPHPGRDKGYEHYRDHKRRRGDKDDKYSNDKHHSSRSRRDGHDRSRSRSPDAGNDRRGSKHGTDKNGNSRSYRGERDSDKARYDRKDRSAKHESRRDRRDERDDGRHGDDSSRSRRKDREYEDRSSRHSRKSARDGNTGRDKYRETDSTFVQDDAEYADSDSKHPLEQPEGASSKNEYNGRRPSFQAKPGDLGFRIEAGRRARRGDEESQPNINEKKASSTPADDGIGFRIKGRGSLDVNALNSAKEDAAATKTKRGREEKANGRKNSIDTSHDQSTSQSASNGDPYAAEREARQKERMAKEMKRRESATLGKRGRDDFDPPTGPKAGVKKRGRGSYSESYGDDDDRRGGRDRYR